MLTFPVRRTQHNLKPLFAKRQKLVNQIPEFWPNVFLNGPEDVQQFFSPADLAILASIKSFSVDRYQVTSETEGEPRSLRFTFDFGKNDHFEDKKLVKDFEYKSSPGGPGSLVSKPVTIKWRGKKKDVTNGLLDAACELYAAEEAIKLKNADGELEVVDREALWQHEKLREKLAAFDEQPELQPSFLNWFGYRGPVGPPSHSARNANEEGVDEEEDEDDLDTGMLEVEVFPAGEEVAISLAEDLWSDAMDYFSKGVAVNS